MQIKLFYIMGETRSFREKQFSIHKFAYFFTFTEEFVNGKFHFLQC